MTATSNHNPLSQLATVEQNLVGAINAAAGHLDQLGTANVSAAMERLKASASAAQVRLAATVVDLTGTVGDVVEAFTLTTARVLGQLALNGEHLEVLAPTIPAPIAEPVHRNSDGPQTTPDQATVVMTTVEPEPTPTVVITTTVQTPLEATQDAPTVETTHETVQPSIEAHEPSQAHEPAVAVAVAACSPVETPDQTMARVLLGSHTPTSSATPATSKRKSRGKGVKADASSGVADRPSST